MGSGGEGFGSSGGMGRGSRVVVGEEGFGGSGGEGRGSGVVVGWGGVRFNHSTFTFLKNEMICAMS